MRIVDLKEINSIQNSFKELELDGQLLVESYGIRASHYIDKHILKGNDVLVTMLLGNGTNAAEGLCVAKHLFNMNYRLKVFHLFKESDCHQVLKNQIAAARQYGLELETVSSSNELEEFYVQNDSPALLIDAIFGTGLEGDLPNFIYDIIKFVNEYESHILSIDIPSGLGATSGRVSGSAICATLTLANTFPKQGFYIGDGVHHTGEIKVIDSAFPKKLLSAGNKYLLQKEHVHQTLDPRNKFADKKIYGHSLVLGGSHGLTGGLSLAATACLKVGAGLVTAATWEPQYQEFVPRLIPDIMTGYIPLEIDRWKNLIKGLDKYSAIVIGPGLARSSRARRLVLEVLNNFSGPVVLDADAINVLSLKDDEDVFKVRSAPTVITPHMGEFSRFSGIEMDDLAANPVEHLKNLVARINCTVILKGPCTFLGLTDGNIYFNYSPNDGMATGGVGDVLAGILGGLLGQKSLKDKKLSLSKRYEELNKTVITGVLIHTMAGEEAAKELGVRFMSASSLIDCLPEVFLKLDAEFTP